MSDLTQSRTRVTEALEAAGISAAAYTDESLSAPVAVVLPGDPYVSLPVGPNPFGKPYSLNLKVLLISEQGTNETTATQIDSMISKAVIALEDDWDIAEVGGPEQITLQGVSHMGAVIALTLNIEMEVM